MIDLFIFAAAAAQAAVPTLTGVFDCKAEVPMIISQQTDKVQFQRMGGIEAGKMAFTMQLKGKSAQINWPASPINVDGKGKVIATAPDAGMAYFTADGPCTFTNQGCATMVNFVKQADGNLRLLLSPTALLNDAAAKTKLPFLVIIPGMCIARKEVE
jgi:hypothetical protein